MLFGGRCWTCYFFLTSPFTKRDDSNHLLAIFLVFVGSIYMLEKVLYKNVRSTKFWQTKNNLKLQTYFGKDFPIRKATLGKIFFFSFGYLGSSVSFRNCKFIWNTRNAYSLL